MPGKMRDITGLWSSMILSHTRASRLAVLAAAGVLLLLFSVTFPSALSNFQEQLGAIAWKISPDPVPEERISIVAIDERSIESLGAWPWSRETMATLSAAIDAAGAQLEIYDMVFPEAQPGDAVFAAALGGNAVLAQVPVLSGNQQVQAGLLGSAVTGVNCNDNNALTPQASYFLGNNPGLSAVAKGHIAPRVDADGGVRRVPALICVDGQAYPALAVAALLKAAGSSNLQVRLSEGASLFDAAATLSLPAFPGLTIPLDENGNFRVSYRQDPSVFQAFSAVDVIEGRIPAGALDNTWALVGYTAFGLVDSVPTPFAGAAPGVEIQARILTSLLDDAIPHTPRSANWLLFGLGLLFAVVLLGIVSLKEKAAFMALALAGIVLPGLALLLHVQLLVSFDIWLGWLYPALYAVLGSSLFMVHELFRLRQERGRVLHNLTAYLPTQLAREIAYRSPDSEISARRQNVTLLSADLRNFSAYTEARPPEETATVLHAFFTKAAEILAAHEGQVFEFRGDGLLAYWEQHESASVSQALEAAAALQQALAGLLEQTNSQSASLEPLALGIGIEAGPVLIGSIGSASRRTPTLLGETVTIAMRIQDMTADLAQPVLVGEAAARQVPEYGLQSQGSFLLNGLQTPHTLFAPLANVQPDEADTPRLKVLLGGRL